MRNLPASEEAVRGILLGRRRVIAGVFDCLQIRNNRIIDRWRAKNLITAQGENHVLDIVLSGGTQITAWNLALKDDTGDPPDGAETYATPIFVEIEDYDEATRVVWTDGGVSSGSIDNSGSPADFSINATVSVFGIALVGGGSAPTTKGDTAGGGTMFSVANFATQKDLNNGDTLRVTYTVTAADDGV